MPENATKTYRVGVIGRTGKGNYGHGLERTWDHIDQANVVAVADENETAGRAVAKRIGAEKTYTDYREMLAKEKLDIVTVCPRYLDQHHEMVLACAEHGAHVYMEKPFVRNLEEADELVDIFERKHLKLAIAHTTRYSPQVRVALKMIADGKIGDVLELRARGKEDSRRGGGEDLWVLGSHMLDLMRMIAGNVANCYATVHEQGRPIQRSDVKPGNEGIGPLAGDAVDATYEFANGTGIRGYFASHRGAAGRPTRFGMRVYGSKGAIEFQSGYLRPAWILEASSWSPAQSNAKWVPISLPDSAKPETQGGASHSGGNHAAGLDLIDAIENDHQPVSNIYDARGATEMIVACFESQRQGGPVDFPLKNRKNPLTMLDS